MPVGRWRNAVYSMWFFVGLAIIVLLLIPETPRFLAQRGNHEKAKKVMMQIYGTVPDYNLEHEYSIILKEIEDGRVLAENGKELSVLDCFRGTNLVSLIVDPFYFLPLTRAASNHCLSRPVQQPALGWCSGPLLLHLVLLPASRHQGGLPRYCCRQQCPCQLCGH